MNALRDWLDRQARHDPALYHRLAGRSSVLAAVPDRGILETTRAKGDARLARSLFETIVREGRPAFLVRNGGIIDDDGLVSGAAQEIVERMRRAEEPLRAAIPLVGRIDAVGHPRLGHLGTGWLVGPEVVVTNRHVASLVAEGHGGAFEFRSFGERQCGLGIDYLREHGNTDQDAVTISEILWIEPDRHGPDVAFLKVPRRGDGSARDRIDLAVTDCGPDIDVAVIGYPARAIIDHVPDQALMDRIYRGTYDVKRIAPGRTGVTRDGSATHDCTTLGGNSGSVVIDLREGHAVALHFAGRYMVENYAVPASVLRRYIREAPWQGRGADIQRPSKHVTGLPARNRIGEIGHVEAAAWALAQDLAGQGILAVRPGYLLGDGALSDEDCIVVSARADRVEDMRSIVPDRYGGWPVNFRAACLHDQLPWPDPLGAEGVASTLYDDGRRADPRYSLEPVLAWMSVECHVGPERSWDVLRPFLDGTRAELVCGIYEFHAKHVAAGLSTILERGGSITLVLGGQSRDPKDGTIPVGDFSRSQTFDDWSIKHAERFVQVYVPTGSRGLVANAYHIKLAVRDSDAFWLSSGNWRRTSQPALDAADRDDPRRVGRSGNREWHVVVEEPTLATRLRSHILADLDQSRELGSHAEGPGTPAILVDVPLNAWDQRLEEAAARDILEPIRITRRIRVTPLLTPDGQGRVYRDGVQSLVAGATRSICLQNQYINLVSAPEGHLSQLVDMLVVASQRTDVRILLRSGMSGLLENMEALKRKGLDVARCVRVLTATHTKGIIVDGERVMVGSQNWSEPAVTLNRDASLIFDDVEIASYFQQAFDMDWDRARKPVFEAGGDGADVMLAEGEAAAAGYRRITMNRYLEG